MLLANTTKNMGIITQVINGINEKLTEFWLANSQYKPLLIGYNWYVRHSCNVSDWVNDRSYGQLCYLDKWEQIWGFHIFLPTIKNFLWFSGTMDHMSYFVLKKVFFTRFNDFDRKKQKYKLIV